MPRIPFSIVRTPTGPWVESDSSCQTRLAERVDEGAVGEMMGCKHWPMIDAKSGERAGLLIAISPQFT